MKLPKHTKNQQTGNIAASVLDSILSRFAIINPHKEAIDLGIDMRGQITENELPKEEFFNIQCKGTEEASDKKDILKYQIKVSTINFWNQQNEVTYLFLVDIKAKKCYWSNALEQLKNRMLDIQSQEKVTLYVEKNNFIDESTLKLSKEFIDGIKVYSVKRLDRLVSLAEQITSEISFSDKLDVTLNFEIIEMLLESADKIKENYNHTAKSLLKNTLKKLDESREYFHKLDQIDLARKYCPEGLLHSKGFSSKDITYAEILEEVIRNIKEFESNIDDVNKLKLLRENYSDLKDISNNLLGFLYEMTCEDNPLGDHSELHSLMYIH